MSTKPSHQKWTEGVSPDFEKLTTHELEEYLIARLAQVRSNLPPATRKRAKIEAVQNRKFWGLRLFLNDQFVELRASEIPPFICLRQHELLRSEADRLKKAWLILVGLLGREELSCTEHDLCVPKYIEFDNQQLRISIRELHRKIRSACRAALLDWSPKNIDQTTTWLAERFDEWKTPVHCLGRVHEVERALGPLAHRRHMHCPPYAQVVLQNFHGAGIRHPEYHLSADLALLYNLFLDSEEIIALDTTAGVSRLPEHSQSLGRSIILTCFNLLEAFITGLAADHLHSHPNAPLEIAQKLRGLSTKGKYVDLRLEQKYTEFLPLITGKPWLDVDKPPFIDLFGRCKLHRNALAHPSMPVYSDDHRRVQNESYFHDITVQSVCEITDLTLDAICSVWKRVYGGVRPSWLRLRQEDGRFPHVDASLRRWAPACSQDPIRQIRRR